MKITLATFKAFIRKADLVPKTIYVKQTSSFDGMVDCVAETKDEFRIVDNIDFSESNTLGIRGLWLVLGGRDHFEKFQGEYLSGIRVSNSCGSSIIATERD